MFNDASVYLVLYLNVHYLGRILQLKIREQQSMGTNIAEIGMFTRKETMIFIMKMIIIIMIISCEYTSTLRINVAAPSLLRSQNELCHEYVNDE